MNGLRRPPKPPPPPRPPSRPPGATDPVPSLDRQESVARIALLEALTELAQAATARLAHG